MNEVKLTTEQIQFMRDNGPVIFTTSSDDQPRACIVQTNGIYDNSIIIDDVQMGKTAQNVKTNKKVSVLSSAPDYSRWLKISGIAEYLTDGELVKERKEKANPKYLPKAVIQIKITEVEDVTD